MAISSSYFVPTGIGRVKVFPNSATAAFVSLGESINSPEGFQIEVHGVKYTGSLRLGLVDGKWGVYTGNGDPNGFHALSLSRSDRKDPSFAAQRKVKEVVIPAIQAFFDACPEILERAEAAELGEQIERATAKVAATRKSYEAAQQELDRLLLHIRSV